MIGDGVRLRRHFRGSVRRVGSRSDRLGSILLFFGRDRSKLSDKRAFYPHIAALGFGFTRPRRSEQRVIDCRLLALNRHWLSSFLSYAFAGWGARQMDLFTVANSVPWWTEWVALGIALLVGAYFLYRLFRGVRAGTVIPKNQKSAGLIST